MFININLLTLILLVIAIIVCGIAFMLVYFCKRINETSIQAYEQVINYYNKCLEIYGEIKRSKESA